MSANLATNIGLAKKINLFCLLAAIAIVLVLPLKKQIWYDETISILCAHGISHATPAQLANITTLTSDTLNALNTPGNVFTATVYDNANSYLYNITLHYWAILFGNTLGAYMLLCKLCAIITLLAFFTLCRQFFGDSPFTAIAILLLLTDNNFTGMSHEVRAYAMGIMFVTLAAVPLCKYLFLQEKPRYLLLTSLFSVAAILAHFLTAYIILVFVAALLIIKWRNLFTPRKVLYIILPLSALALFFALAYHGLQIMSRQNHDIQQRLSSVHFSLGEVLLRSVKFTEINFKIVFPAFAGSLLVIIASLVLLKALYIYGYLAARSRAERQKLIILAALGISSTIFLALLSIKAHHYTSLYNRYYSFCVPFCSLATAYILYLIFKNVNCSSTAYGGLLSVIVMPSIMLCILFNRPTKPTQSYNHPEVAQAITAYETTLPPELKRIIPTLTVPAWNEALLVHCFLPARTSLQYIRDTTAPNFTIATPGATPITIPVIRHD
jgi:hypothetical protein